MEIQDLSDLYRKLKAKQISITDSFLCQNMCRHKLLLDISNKYLFDTSIITLKRLISKSYGSCMPIKTLVLQNCMLTAASANSVLLIFLNFPGKINLSSLDLGNNSITLSVELSTTIAKVLEKSSKNEPKSLNLQGNIISDPEAFSVLIACESAMSSLSLYDCNLQPQLLVILTESMTQNKSISKLDLSYNPEAFTSKSITHSLGVALGTNNYLTSLKLSGNPTLSRKSLFNKLCIGLRHSSSLEKLYIGNLALNDSGLNILRKRCLNFTNIECLDLQNNKITCKGFIKLIRNFPSGLNKLVVSYNRFEDSKVLLELGKMMQDQRSIRILNISYCFVFDSVVEKCMKALCIGISENRSLTELIMEGCKIGDDPDYFCKQLSEAIEARKFPITFRISAVRTYDGNASIYLSKTNDRILKDLI